MLSTSTKKRQSKKDNPFGFNQAYDNKFGSPKRKKKSRDPFDIT